MLVASLLTACGSLKPSDRPSFAAPVELPELPEDLRGCDGPAPINYAAAESGVMGPVDLFRGWALDRKRLSVCARKVSTLSGFYLDLQEQLNPKPEPEQN